jgi:excisionase family DNA binding protein
LSTRVWTRSPVASGGGDTPPGPAEPTPNDSRLVQIAARDRDVNDGFGWSGRHGRWVYEEWTVPEALEGALRRRQDPVEKVEMRQQSAAARRRGANSGTRGTSLPRLVGIAEIADHLGVTVRHVRLLVAQRRIPYMKWGHLLRFDPDQVREWLDEAHVDPRVAKSRSTR